jgi:hypothetical protein
MGDDRLALAARRRRAETANRQPSPAGAGPRVAAFRAAGGRAIRHLTAAAAAHPAFAVLLLIAIVIRALAMVAYPPALFFNDSWGYVFTAFTGHPVSLSYLRPNGYPVLMRLLTIPGRDLVQLVALQHLSGLVTGTLVYATLIRARVDRGLALVAGAVVLLDGYRIVLEQYLMPEAFYTLTLLLAALVVAWPRLGKPSIRPSLAGPRAAALAGLLLAAAVIQREAALFAAPAFVIYLAWTRVGLVTAVAFVLALAMPVLGYAALYEARLGVFGLTETSGWTLYGRVAGFASCAGAGIPRSQRPLCETAAQRASHPASPTYYIWDGNSPAERLFHGGHQTREIQERANRILDDFAHRIILHQPLQYLDASISDAVRYFTPGATPFNDAVSATSLPASGAAEPKSERIRRRVLPTMHPQVRPPAGVVRRYRSILHLPRPLLAILALASLAAILLRSAVNKEVLLLTGSGLLMILGTAATAGFGIRYLLPTVPLLAIGGSLAIHDLAVRARDALRR